MIMRPRLRLSGYVPSMPTPFDKAGELDIGALQRLCNRQIDAGATALVVCEATGEPSSLSPKELAAVVRTAADCSRGRIPIVAGAGSNATSQAVELTHIVQAAGADAILSVVPYYNKPTQAGIYAHFRAVAETTDLPVILHDVPSRTICSLADDTLARLAALPHVAGFLDATGDAARLLRLRALLGPEFILLSGDDRAALAYLSLGGDGCVSITANVAPRLCHATRAAWIDGQLAQARQRATAAARLTEALLTESNPSPLKYAMSVLNLMRPHVRLPLVEPTGASKLRIDTALAEMAAEYPEFIQ
jgi:4-hydroxy-tetrahydrodipicolinate synthase